MRTLFVFDDDATPEAVVAGVDGATHVDLFPLTSRWDHLGVIERQLEDRVETLRRLDVPRLVEGAAVREQVPEVLARAAAAAGAPIFFFSAAGNF